MNSEPYKFFCLILLARLLTFHTIEGKTKINEGSSEAISLSGRSVGTSYYGYPKVNEIDIDGGASKVYTFTIPEGNEHNFIADFSSSTATLDNFEIDVDIFLQLYESFWR